MQLITSRKQEFDISIFSSKTPSSPLIHILSLQYVFPPFVYTLAHKEHAHRHTHNLQSVFHHAYANRIDAEGHATGIT